MSHPIPEPDRELVRRLVSDLGERGAAEALGVSDATLSRILAGRGVYPGTRALVTQALARFGNITL
jgi:hypothetical protein